MRRRRERKIIERSTVQILGQDIPLDPIHYDLSVQQRLFAETLPTKPKKVKDIIVEAVKLLNNQRGTKEDILKMASVLHPQYKTQFNIKSIEQALTKYLVVCP